MGWVGACDRLLGGPCCGAGQGRTADEGGGFIQPRGCTRRFRARRKVLPAFTPGPGCSAAMSFGLSGGPNFRWIRSVVGDYCRFPAAFGSRRGRGRGRGRRSCFGVARRYVGILSKVAARIARRFRGRGEPNPTNKPLNGSPVGRAVKGADCDVHKGPACGHGRRQNEAWADSGPGHCLPDGDALSGKQSLENDTTKRAGTRGAKPVRTLLETTSTGRLQIYCTDYASIPMPVE